MYSYYPQAATTTVVSTEGQVWNGTSWGAAAPSGTSSTCSPESSAASLVQLYTGYYHSYLAWVEHSQAEADKCTSPADASRREEYLRHREWYRHYAQESSRAAHFYYQNPNSLTPPPFDLPPAPPNASDNHNRVPQDSSSISPSFNASQQQDQPKQPSQTVAVDTTGPAPASSSANSSSPDGLKRFFHTCLQACTTEQQRKEVQSKLEQLISKAIQEGTLHTTNWDALEPIRPTWKVGERPTASQANAVASGSSFNAPGVDAASQNKRVWQETERTRKRVVFIDSPPGANKFSPSPQNKRTRYQTSEDLNTLGNRDYVFGRSTSLTPPLTETTRVTPPLETTPTSISNYYGPSTYRFDKQLSSNDSYYGPGPSPPQNEQMDSYNGGRVSESSEDDFVAIPQLPRSGNAKAWRNKNGFERTNSVLTKRANRFGNATSLATPGLDSSNFDKYMGKGMIGGSTKKLDEADFEMMTVKGTCTRLEKEYLRLTAPPRAELVRPQYILEQHFDNLVKEWKSKSRRDYLWFCSQFKALRQDCRVQRIQNSFCVRVYETHARIALESDDLNEFNQCQTQLMELYDLLLLSPSVPTKEQDAAREHRNEFLAYRFIYYVFLTGNHKGSSSSSDLMTLMLSLTPELWNDPAIAHAARIREAVASMDYHSFFRLRRQCPNLGAFLVDRMVPLIRFNALQRICKAYRPMVELPFVLSELGFNSSEMADGNAWLESCGCVLQDGMVSTKETVVRESNLQAKQSLI